MQFYGGQVSLQASLLETILLSEGKPFQCVFDNSKSYDIRDFTQLDLEACKDTQPFFIHASHCVVLNSEKPYVRACSSKAIKKTLDIIQPLNAYSVVHCGSGTKERLISSINKLEHSGHLLLENSAGQRNQIGKTWEELRLIWEGFDYPTQMCFDTQHAFAAGMTKLDSYNSFLEVLEEIDAITGYQPKCIHLNDSEVAFGSRKDRHMVLGRGFIFSERGGVEALSAIFEHAGPYSLISETQSFEEDVKFVRGHVL